MVAGRNIHLVCTLTTITIITEARIVKYGVTMDNIQDVSGRICHTSGEGSLGYITSIYPEISLSEVERYGATGAVPRSVST